MIKDAQIHTYMSEYRLEPTFSINLILKAASFIN